MDMHLLCQILSTIIFLNNSGHVWSQHVSLPAPECYSPSCPCCVVVCSSDGSGHCGGNCKDGYHGGKCLNYCPFNCIRCVDAIHGGGIANCTHCKAGYYSTLSMYQCQSNCSSNCRTCESSALNCTSCQDGYYLNRSYQCARCNEACMSCSSASLCTSCKVGFYLNQSIGLCHSCNSLCFSCDSANTCYCSNGCADGGYLSRSCNVSLNMCVFGCRENFTSYNTNVRCDACIDGNYGVDCDLQCSHNCESEKCERFLGNCLQCKAGFYGDNCQTACPRNCFISCDRISGQCESCMDGFYGINCTQKCLPNCRKCASSNGSCVTCKDGFYGEECNLNCAVSCQNYKCSKVNGSCMCIIGYTGHTCEVRITTQSMTGLSLTTSLPPAAHTYVGPIVGIVLAAVLIIGGTVGLGVWCYRRRNHGIGSGNRSLLGITSHLSDIENVEKDIANIDLQLKKLNARMEKFNEHMDRLHAHVEKIGSQSNKLRAQRSELETKLEGLKRNIPYQNTNRADNIEDKSYEMLQRANNESQYSTLQ